MKNTLMKQRYRFGAAALVAMLCASLAACGDGTNSNGAAGSSAAANTAAAGAGGASAPVAIVAAPASGSCAASGATASQPLLNTQLDCAP
jgi:hypothetical protein